MIYGHLAMQCRGIKLPIQVLKSGCGYYIGTFDEQGPCSRESVEYWPTQDQANNALVMNNWTQRDKP